MRSRLHLFDARAQSFFIIFEERELPVRSGLLVIFAQQTVSACGHPIAGVAGEEVEPFAIAMIVEQLGFMVVELLDFELKLGSLFRHLNAH